MQSLPVMEVDHHLSAANYSGRSTYINRVHDGNLKFLTQYIYKILNLNYD